MRLNRRALLRAGVGGAALSLGAMSPKDVTLISAINSNNSGPTLDLNFATAITLDGRITFSRASAATSGIYTDAAGSSYTSYSTDVARLIATKGLLIEGSRTNSLLNSDTPVTQTTASLGAGAYALWVIGTGSATSSAGTATGSGFGAATAGTPNTFTLSGAGTVVVTVAGSLARFQLELGAFPTSYIPTTGAAATRAQDVASMPLGTWYNTSVVSIAAEVLKLNTPASDYPGIVDFSDGSLSNRVTVYVVGGTTQVWVLEENAGAVEVNSTVGSYTPGTLFKTAATIAASGWAGCLGGGGVVSGASPNFPGAALNILAFGVENGNSLDGYLGRVRYWSRVLSNAELQTVTT